MRALLDTSVVIDPSGVDWPDDAELAISTITVGELGFGIIKAEDQVERAKRTVNLQRVRAVFEELPVDGAVAEAYAAVATAVHIDGRSPRPRGFDLLIAATAMAHDMPLYTRDMQDVATLRQLIDVRVV